ncbi:MAG: SDR family oxidoreductase [Bacteroides sp.]|nr:SDR family oxidoreductase [Bacteroides sp.]
MIDIDLSGKKAFVTGGGRGIGRTIVERFSMAGADVVAPTRAELDLSDRKSIEAFIQSNPDMEVDIFVHCAGVNELAGIGEIDRNLLSRVFDVNLFAPIDLLKAFHANMKQKRWGRIVFISSLYSIVSKERRLAYSASKNALTGICKSLAIELGGDNVLVNGVAPGYVLTDMTRKNLSEKEIAEIKENIPTHRFQSTEDIANTVVFLCSALNQSITGQLIAVDGGFTCK